jgi:tetratricopeptide (TPR) repeat protein
MPNENTPEYSKALYDHAVGVSRGPDLVYAIQLLERLTELRDQFYTAFALALLEQTYKRLGREDLVERTLKRITELPESEQLLLNPNWLAFCYQKTGDLNGAKAILADIKQLSPEDPSGNPVREISGPIGAVRRSESAGIQ